MKNNQIIFSILTIATLLTLIGCNQATSDNEIISIGAIAPLTGNNAHYGIEEQRIAEMALANVNTAWAEKKMTLNIQWEDGACDSKNAANAAHKLIDIDKVQIIYGGLCDTETLATAPIAEEANTLLFSSSGSPKITTAGNFVFRNWPSDAFQGEKIAELANELSFTTVAMITEQQDYPLSISKVFQEKFEIIGGTTIEEIYLSEENDLKPQLTKLNNHHPSVFFINAQTPIKSEIILKQMQDLGIQGPFLLNDVAGTNSEFIKKFTDYLEGSYTATPYINLDSEKFKALQTEYQTIHGEAIVLLDRAAATYDAIQILAQAIETAGNSGIAIQSYLNDFTGYNGLMGHTDFDANGDTTNGHSIYRISEGTLHLQ